MSALDPSGPSQPNKTEAYTTEENPITKDPAEKFAASFDQSTSDAADTIERRIPREQASSDEAQRTPLTRGVHGAGSGEEAYGRTYEDVGKHRELDAEQMAAPGEGKVYDAVEGWGSKGKPGASGSQPDLASELDRKKADQAPLRAEIASQRQRGVDVGGILGQSGGPANPVD